MRHGQKGDLAALHVACLQKPVTLLEQAHRYYVRHLSSAKYAVIVVLYTIFEAKWHSRSSYLFGAMAL